MKKSIFEVSTDGLRETQSGKPKYVIIRELLQNALDEEITTCNIELKYEQGKAKITVTDDSAEGFRDMSDSYTLFATTYKRGDVKKRGKFNFGEKQVICLCDYARIISTKGGVEFFVLKGERKNLKKKRDTGSEVYVEVKMTHEEYASCVEYCSDIIVPENINVKVSYAKPNTDALIGKLIDRPSCHKKFSAKLLTEVKEGDEMRNVSRDTEVHVYHPHNTKTYIYEMGIPICEIECDYSIDVQQKVPLSADRDKVDAKYLKIIYGEVLNHVCDEIKPEQSSNIWIRDGFSSDRAYKETRQDIITKRFGEKALIANPNDRRSMDEAISNNYNVIYGSEMSGEEWSRVKENGLLVSTSQQFKCGVAEGKMVSPDENQKMIAVFCRKVSKDMLGISISVKFYDSPDATVIADYSSERNELRFNVAHISDAMFASVNGRVGQEMLDLIIHELGHSAGMHYEHSYHDCITLLGSKLAIKALEQPEWFTLGVGVPVMEEK
jgi:hypothetical protein